MITYSIVLRSFTRSANFSIYIHLSTIIFPTNFFLQFRNIERMTLFDEKNQIVTTANFDFDFQVSPKDIPKSCIKLNHEFHPAIIVTTSRYQPLHVHRTSFTTANPSMDRPTRHERNPSLSRSTPPLTLFDPIARCLLERRSNTPIIPDRSPRNFLTCFLNFGHAPAYVILHTSVPFWPICHPLPLLTKRQLGIGGEGKFISNNNNLYRNII